MKILITGSKGQLGKELTKQLQLDTNIDIVATDKRTLDVTNYKMLESFFMLHRPNVIINCAAYTAVDNCEQEVRLAYEVNSLGPKYLAILADKFNAKLIHISTDYVFDGNMNIDENGDHREYCECDQVNPQTVYGKSKVSGERFVQAYCDKHFIIRTAWLYGEGKNFLKTMLDLSQRVNQLKVVDDQVGTPTSTYELSRAIISLLDSEEYGIYHGTCKGQCTWYEFTTKIFDILNIETKVIPCTSDEYVRPAKRPSYSVLGNCSFEKNNGYEFMDWEIALEDYLKQMNDVANRVN